MEALFGHPILQSLLAGILSWISVSLGASAIFLRREFSWPWTACWGPPAA